MSDLLHAFKALRRPKILIRAAKIGGSLYRRDRDLKRVLKRSRLPAPGNGMAPLIAMEQELETTRLAGNATYSISRHVEVLAALIAEASLLPRPENPALR